MIDFYSLLLIAPASYTFLPLLTSSFLTCYIHSTHTDALFKPTKLTFAFIFKFVQLY